MGKPVLRTSTPIPSTNSGTAISVPLFADGHPDLDADFPAHPVLAAFDGDFIRHMTPPDAPRHFTGSIQQTAMTDLGMPAYRP